MNSQNRERKRGKERERGGEWGAADKPQNLPQIVSIFVSCLDVLQQIVPQRSAAVSAAAQNCAACHKRSNSNNNMQQATTCGLLLHLVTKQRERGRGREGEVNWLSNARTQPQASHSAAQHICATQWVQKVCANEPQTSSFIYQCQRQYTHSSPHSLPLLFPSLLPDKFQF